MRHLGKHKSLFTSFTYSGAMKRRIAIVTESFLPQINGVSNSVLRILETLKQREIEAIVIAPTRASSHHLGFPIYTVPSLEVINFPVGIPSPSVAKQLDDFQPDLVHIAAPFWLGSHAIEWCRRKSVPSVAVYQTDISGYCSRYGLDFARPLVDRMTAMIHAPATVSLAPTKEAAEKLGGLGVKNVSIWGRGVDTDLFHPDLRLTAQAQILKRKIAPKSEIVVGFVGRLAAEKQVHRLLEIAELPNTKLLIVGDGPERERLQNLFAPHGAYFAGMQTGLSLANHYAAIDIFVHCGTEETFGQTIQEAKAAGAAVVGPDRGGPRHLIEHGTSGLLVNPDKPAGYREAVEALLDSSLRQKVSRNARESVISNTWARNNSDLMEIYDSVLGSTERVRNSNLELA